MEFDIMVDDCNISSELKQVLKSEGYDTLYKIVCEPIMILLRNSRICDNWDGLVDLIGDLRKDGTLEKLCSSITSPTLHSSIDSTALSGGVKYILYKAGYVVVSDIWHAGTSGLGKVEGMTNKALTEISSYMKSINLELLN